MLGSRVIVDSFCEDLLLTEGFKSPGGSWINCNQAPKWRTSSLVAVLDGLRGHTNIVIKTVLDKTKMATYLLVLSATSLAAGLAIVVLFPNTDLGSTVSTASTALACMLQACVASCQVKGKGGSCVVIGVKVKC